MGTVLSGFPWGGIELPRPPLLEVLSVAYVDDDDAEATLSGSPAPYFVVPSGRYARAVLTPLSGAIWPTTASRPDAVTITYQAGYSDPNEGEYQLIKARIGLDGRRALQTAVAVGAGAEQHGGELAAHAVLEAGPMTQDAGRRDRCVTVQQRNATDAVGASGAPVEAWTTVDEVFMHKRDTTGRAVRGSAARGAGRGPLRDGLPRGDGSRPGGCADDVPAGLSRPDFDVTSACHLGRQDGIESLTVASSRIDL